MKQFTNWFQQVVTKAFDQDREARIQTLVQVIERGIQVYGPQFTLNPTLGNLAYSVSDLDEARGRVYGAALARGWSDGTLNEVEQKTAQWLAAKLGIQADQARQLEMEQALKHFGLALAHAMQDGILDSEEEARLSAISAAVGSNTAAFMRSFFQTEGQSLLRSIFLACVADNSISQSDWDYLLHVARRFGLTQQELLAVIRPQATQFVERVLADAKSDGKITPDEQRVIFWLLDNLHIPAEIRNYVVAELEIVQSLAAIAEGRLPSIAVPAGMEHRSGEIMHWFGPAVWREFRVRRNEMVANDHDGLLALTDNRLIFSSQRKSKAISYRRIVAHSGSQGWIEVQLEGKPVSQYLLRQPSAIPYAIFQTAVAMSNQTRLATSAGENSRHIPREVRQRVWQRYGGRCAECQATSYLEFDHIIPVARGGSNMDANVQLLCRMCNSKKSDHI
jgi:tellurite resistance protein